MVPVLGGKVEEGEQSLPVLSQTSDRLLVLGAVFVGEHVDRRLGRRAGRRAVNFTKVCFHVGLDREGDLVQHVGGLMDPTPLMPSAGKDLLDRFPEAERPVADREVTSILHYGALLAGLGEGSEQAWRRAGAEADPGKRCCTRPTARRGD